MIARIGRFRLTCVVVLGCSFLLSGGNCEDAFPIECRTGQDCPCASFCPNGVVAASCFNFACQCVCREPGTGGTGGSGGMAGTGGSGGEGGTAGAGGVGGMGGTVDPCDIALPVPAPGSDLRVDVYAVFETQQAAISFATDGTLFAGNFGRNQADDPSAVFWVTPGADAINNSSPTLFDDPDALVVDADGLVAAAGNVLIGGVNADGNGQITEMTPVGANAGALFVGGCLGNISHLLFDNANRLIVTNFNEANVCVVQAGAVSELIDNVEGDGPAGVTVQDPDTGDLFVTSDGIVHRYSSDGTLEQANYIVGSALAHGPVGSRFDGLLLRASGMLFLLPEPDNPANQEPLLSGAIGGSVAFDADGNLYISNAGNRRVLRVSPDNLPPTIVGCP